MSEMRQGPPVSEMAPLAVEQAAQKLADIGDWKALVRFVSPHLTRAARPRTLFLATMAATELPSPALLDTVIDLAMGMDLPSHIALGMARRLAMAGETSAAWSILLTAKSLVGAEQHVQAYAGVLAIIIQLSKDRTLRTAAMAYRRRLTGMAAPAHADEVIVWGADHTPAVLVRTENPIQLFNQEAAPPKVLEELQQVRSAFESAVARDVRPSVRVYRDVLVNRDGQVWRDDGEILVANNRPLSPGSIAAAHGAPMVESAMLAMEDAGLYHWLCEWLPSLFWAAYQGAASPTLLLSDRGARYQAASLDLLTLAAPRLMVGDAVRVGRLHIGDRRLLNYWYWGAYEKGFRYINEAAAVQAPRPAVADIYISRRDASRRPILNEAELVLALRGAGFTPVELSALSIAEQIALFSGARRIVAPHGAGLSHLLAKQDPASVLELFPMSAGSMSLRYNFARLSRLRGHRHALHLEQINPLTNEWSVDIPRVLMAAESVFQGQGGR